MRKSACGVLCLAALAMLCGCASKEELADANARTAGELVRIEKRIEAMEEGVEALRAERAADAEAARQETTKLAQRADVLDGRMNNLARSMDEVKGQVAAAARAPAPAPRAVPAAAAAPGSGGVAGSWTANFHFEKNTANPGEAPHPWLVFQLDLQQAGDMAKGTLKGVTYAVSGTVTGKATSEGFDGTMRLSWDSHDWDVLRFTIGADGRTAQGEAIFGASETEKHHYRLELTRR